MASADMNARGTVNLMRRAVSEFLPFESEREAAVQRAVDIARRFVTGVLGLSVRLMEDELYQAAEDVWSLYVAEELTKLEEESRLLCECFLCGDVTSSTNGTVHMTKPLCPNCKMLYLDRRGGITIEQSLRVMVRLNRICSHYLCGEGDDIIGAGLTLELVRQLGEAISCLTFCVPQISACSLNFTEIATTALDKMNPTEVEAMGTSTLHQLVEACESAYLHVVSPAKDGLICRQIHTNIQVAIGIYLEKVRDAKAALRRSLRTGQCKAHFEEFVYQAMIELSESELHELTKDELFSMAEGACKLDFEWHFGPGLSYQEHVEVQEVVRSAISQAWSKFQHSPDSVLSSQAVGHG